MIKFEDTGWLKLLPANADNLPEADNTEEYSWYNSAWLYKALFSEQEADRSQAIPFLRQYIANPIQLHWLLQRGYADGTPEKTTDESFRQVAQVIENDVIEENKPEEQEAPVMAEATAKPDEKTVAEGELTGLEAEQEMAQTDREEPPLFAGRLEQTLKAASAALQTDEQDGQTNLPAFMPHHTVDYFEAVGVKLAATTDKDKLQTQVKSFTQWLKAMKQINYQTGAVIEDSLVTQKATDSLKENLVKTETMAEVLIKQGKIEAAAAIFTELQLLYPDKSAYFAARLEKLK